MKIGGLQRFSLSDFPGYAAAIVFTQGCNFRCPYCHNGALIGPEPEPEAPSEEAVMRFLQSRRKQLDGVVISGGEPSIQPDLIDFARRVKSMGYRVKLDTNGSHPEVIARLLEEGLLDYIAMDIKAPLESYRRLAGVTVSMSALEESIALLSWSGIDHEFRTTDVAPLLRRADIAAIQGIVPRGSRHRLQPFRAELARDKTLHNALPADDAEEAAGAA